jgi:hypothetical protein
VTVIESDASANYLRRELWNDLVVIPVAGQLGTVAMEPRQIDEFVERWEVDAQLLAALGDRSKSFYMDDQAESLTHASFTGQSRTPGVVRQVGGFIQSRLNMIEDLGLAEAASPLTLTRAGEATRLTGLTLVSGHRMKALLDETEARGTLESIASERELTRRSAQYVARAVMEASEVFSTTMAVRFSGEPIELLERWEAVGLQASEFEDLIVDDVNLLSGWILGAQLHELLRWSPIRRRGRFSGTEDDRILDLVEHLGRESPSAAWAWSSYLTMMDALSGSEGAVRSGGWVGGAITHGVPSRSSVTLCEVFGLSRDESLLVSARLIENGMPADDPDTIRDWVWEGQETLVASGVDIPLVEQIIDLR